MTVLERTFATGAAGRAGGSDGRNRIVGRAGTVARYPLGKFGRQLVDCGQGALLSMHGLSPGVMEKTQARTAAAKIFCERAFFSCAIPFFGQCWNCQVTASQILRTRFGGFSFLVGIDPP
jgi:hypothetical protein